MSYTPPAGDQVRLAFVSGYEQPAGDNIHLAFGDSALVLSPNDLGRGHDPSCSGIGQAILVAPDHRTSGHALSCDGICFALVPYSVVRGHHLDDADIDQAHIIRGDALNHGHALAGSAEALPDYIMPSGISGGVRMGWGAGSAVERRVKSSWESAIAVDHTAGDGWQDAPGVEHRIDSGWADMPAVDIKTDIPITTADPVDVSVSSGFGSMQAFDLAQSMGWDEMSDVDASVSMPYLSPPPKDVGKSVLWDQFKIEDISIVVPYASPPPKDRTHHTLWGPEHYERICKREYQPPAGDQIRINFTTPISLVGNKDHVDLEFTKYDYDERCTQREPSGWRDAYVYHPPSDVPTVPVRGTYVVLNSLMMCRLPDRVPVDVLSMQISTDINNWCWQLSATIGSKASVDLIAPQPGGIPTEVECEINGWKWVFLIESWDESRQFPGGAWSVTGRSSSATLAAPYAVSSTKTETQERTARQLVEDVLTDTGWSLVWTLPDWLVPGNVFSYAGKTPLGIVQQVVSSVGGVMATSRAEKTIVCSSRFDISAWDFGTATPSLSLPEEIIGSLGSKWDQRPAYDGVYVLGQTTGGILGFVRKAGTAGANQAPMITDALITATEAAGERGRTELSKSGAWTTHSISLPLMADPDLPGLVEPKQIIEVQEKAGSWRGQVTGVSISGSRQSGLTVEQSVEVERYHG